MSVDPPVKLSDGLLTVPVGVSSLLLLLWLFSRRRRQGEPPLIKGWIPFLGKALEFRKDSCQFLQQLQTCPGDVFTVLIADTTDTAWISACLAGISSCWAAHKLKLNHSKTKLLFNAGKYITFVMTPLLYPAVIKQGKQLDFHEFLDSAASATFGYPAGCTEKFPSLSDKIQKSFLLLQGSSLNSLIHKMMRNLQLVLQQHFLSSHEVGRGCEWRQEDLFEFCERVMFEATLLTLYGRPPHINTHKEWQNGPVHQSLYRHVWIFSNSMTHSKTWTKQVT